MSCLRVAENGLQALDRPRIRYPRATPFSAFCNHLTPSRESLVSTSIRTMTSSSVSAKSISSRHIARAVLSPTSPLMFLSSGRLDTMRLSTSNCSARQSRLTRAQGSSLSEVKMTAFMISGWLRIRGAGATIAFDDDLVSHGCHGDISFSCQRAKFVPLVFKIERFPDSSFSLANISH